jgi:hypothetical protein
MVAWAEEHVVKIEYIQPGKPAQNGFVERFNRTYREEVLDAYLFSSLDEARRITADCLLMSGTTFGGLTVSPALHPQGERRLNKLRFNQRANRWTATLGDNVLLGLPHRRSWRVLLEIVPYNIMYKGFVNPPR